MIKSSYNQVILIFLISTGSLLGCSNQDVSSEKTEMPLEASQLALVSETSSSALNQDVVWAVNVGGAEHLGADGIRYQADLFDLGAVLGQIDAIRGAQDPTVYKTYRAGEIHVVKSLPNGTYDISLMFAEPEDLPIASRIFDIFAEGQAVIQNMDVKLARDGNHHSALDRSVVGVEVTDGLLNIDLIPTKGEPVLNGFVVRKKQYDASAWEMVWSDEFEIDGAPDSAKWSYDVWPARKVNTEDQAYTDRINNVRVKDGKLILEAHKERFDNAEYTSGRIHSLGKGDFLYGRAVVRAKLAAGQGTWSAIWMLPSDPFKYASTCGQGADWQGSDDCNAWPNSGEIDIMEHVGYDMNRVHATVHTKDYYWVKQNQRKASVEAKNVSETFHEYAIEWTPDRIDVFFDDTRYYTYINESGAWQAWPFDHPYHIILNLAVGGDWGRAGGPIDDSVFPAKMEVDFVRVYKPVDSANSASVAER
jgi:beta-glucanase (GH16 family)